ncbi:hypothetical protein ACRBEV_09375 [Methylobacterium phyllosphaerae]
MRTPTLTRIGWAEAGLIKVAKLIAAERTQHRTNAMADHPPRQIID